MFMNRYKRDLDYVFQCGYLTGKVIVDAAYRYSMDEAAAVRSLQKYVNMRRNRLSKGENLDYQAIIKDWHTGLSKSYLRVIPGGKT